MHSEIHPVTKPNPDISETMCLNFTKFSVHCQINIARLCEPDDALSLLTDDDVIKEQVPQYRRRE